MRALTSLAIVVVATAAHAEEGVCFDSAVAGQKARKAGHLAEARAAFAQCAQASCPAEVTQRCTDWIAEVDDAMPSIIVDARDAAGRDLAHGTVHIDGHDQDVLSGKPVVLEPGQHVVVLDVPGEPRVEQTIVLHEHEKRRTVVLALAPHAPPPRKLSSTPFVLGGIGLVFAASFGAFATVGFLDRQSSRCDVACASGDYTRVRAELVAADASLGAAALFVGIAIIDFVVTRSSSRKTALVPLHVVF